jgi:hypothetical protein
VRRGGDGVARVEHHGKAVQVGSMKFTLKAPGTKRLKVRCDMLLSTSAFEFSLRRYTSVGSLSSRGVLLGMRVVLANGTAAAVTPASHPFLWRALQVSVGRLAGPCHIHPMPHPPHATSTPCHIHPHRMPHPPPPHATSTQAHHIAPPGCYTKL